MKTLLVDGCCAKEFLIPKEFPIVLTCIPNRHRNMGHVIFDNQGLHIPQNSTHFLYEPTRWFCLLLFAALLLIVSSVTNAKVTAQGNGSSSEKPAAAAKTCSPEQFKEQPGFCASIAALAHNKESSNSAEKPAETGTIISAPVEVKKGPALEENNPSVPLTGELHIKKPATSSNPVSENCLKTKTKNGEVEDVTQKL
jgi:hypothetical protein